SKEWDQLKDYWNHFPPLAAGQRTVHLGLSPLGAAAALLLTDQLDVIKIKVPLGLPDPTPYIPADNPLTYAKWRLGQKLFFDKNWLNEPIDSLYACASCHEPQHGYAEDEPTRLRTRRNTPGLLNSVFNKHQFWDG